MEIDLDNKEFQQVLTLIDHTRHSVFMTGKAGTGKSTFLKYITAHTHKKYVVLAPTGIAAVNAGGQTLHSFFHIPLKPLLPDDPEFSRSRLAKRMKYNKKFVKLLKDLELIIIDEISMVRCDVIDFIDKILRRYSGKEYLPFGGKQILMVGDVFQLDPVVTADAREILRRCYSDFHFFSARVFDDFHLVPIELRKVYRQSDASFISMLDRIRDGHPTAADFAALNARVSEDDVPDPTQFTMTIATRREIVDDINQTFLSRIGRPVFSFEAEVKGDFPETSFPADKTLSLKEGAQVVFIRNDMDHRWVNGSIGRVSLLTAEELQVTLEDGNTYALEPEIWENMEYSYDEEKHTVTEKSKGSFRQFPIRLAWALTIHKSQGLTFNNIRVDLGRGAFTGGQTYVALSRCTSLEGLKLTHALRHSDVYTNPQVSEFARLFNNPGRITGALAAARADQEYAKAAAAFDSGRFGDAYDHFTEAVHARDELSNRLTRQVILRKLHTLADARRREAVLEAELNVKNQLLGRLACEFVEMGLTCLDEGWNAEAALANFDKALSISPDNYEALVGKARAMAMSDDTEAACLLLRGATTDHPKRHEAPYHLGAIFLSAGDYANAIDSLKNAHHRAPSNPDICDLLADVYAESGDPVQAQRFRRQAERLRKKNTEK